MGRKRTRCVTWPRTNYKNMANRKIGRLTVVADSGDRSSGGHVIWLCNCQCGTKDVRVLGTNLRTRNTLSCGCWQREVSSMSRRLAADPSDPGGSQ